jgi:transmembrane sensor
MMVGGGALWQARTPAETLYTTDGAAPRTIALANGAAIKLDRNSEIRVTEGDVSKVILTHGAAFFDAPPDPDPSFDVRVGTYRVSDVGTEFAITRERGDVQVQVAQGTVKIGAEAAPLVSLQQGRAIHISERDGQTRVYRINPEAVASWRSGQLIYDNAPMSVVIADLQRLSGLTITIDPRIADQHFTGVLPIGNGTKLVSDFSSLTGFEAEQRGKSIYLRLPR